MRGILRRGTSCGPAGAGGSGATGFASGPGVTRRSSSDRAVAVPAWLPRLGAVDRVAAADGRGLPALRDTEGLLMRLKGKCRLCGGPVVLLESGAWVHSGFGWFKHAGMVFDRARASAQSDFALAGPSKGGVRG
ncbi:hypothetical protein VG1_CDS0070 [Arthrobacter phage Cupello]|nr:hypothetical protein VG1_CDS0070 [Arthrobacter phage Cupello]